MEKSIGISDKSLYNAVSIDQVNAVSYTHLDVYKRQIIICDMSNKISRVCKKTPLREKSPRPWGSYATKPANKSQDVYKRQN